MIKCPYCGKSHYAEGLSTCTAVYYQPIWKDGVNINPDRNQTTTWCTCLECGKKFLIVNGEVKPVDQPERIKQEDYVVIDGSKLNFPTEPITLDSPITITGAKTFSDAKLYVNGKPLDMYQMIADENELKWFFDHVIEKPLPNESYSAVFVSRHKKLTKEEQATIGLTRKESEFLATQTFRLAKFKDALSIDEENNWTFEGFLKRIRRFNVDKYAYTTSLGEPIPEKTLAIVFYVNPCDDIKVCREFFNQYLDVNQAISKAMLIGKTTVDNLHQYQWFGNAENNLKHLKANQKGSRYWMDFDIDVPKWWKEHSYENVNGEMRTYYQWMKSIFELAYGKGNYVIVDTSGGYHVLVRTSAIKTNPHEVCHDIETIYAVGTTACHEEEYLDENGRCKFECIINDSQIPGLPLPGTYQYGRPVTVLNKEDFE